MKNIIPIHTTITSLITAIAAVGFATAEPSPDERNPFKTGGSASAATAKPGDGSGVPLEECKLTGNILTRYEVFALEVSEAANLQRKHASDADLYKAILDRLSKGAAEQESLISLTSSPGQPAKSEVLIPADQADAPGEATKTPQSKREEENPIRHTALEIDAFVRDEPIIVPLTEVGVKLLSEGANPFAFVPAVDADVEPFGAPPPVDPALKERQQTWKNAIKAGDLKLCWKIELAITANDPHQGRIAGTDEAASPKNAARTIRTNLSAITGTPCLVGSFAPIESEGKRIVRFAFVTCDYQRAEL
jgi:hypothetical protein